MAKTAVIATGGKQYVVRENDVISVEKLGKEAGETITFDEVLLTDDGATASIGTPTVSGASVTGEVLENGLGKKLLVQRYRQKSRSFKRKGHRQPYTKVKITSIK
ncbi:MAG TPA: 50S ribosomal protein L21 [Candidatus Paceibacterota bacterium]|nr:50S ribosomal protein L21 [Candidatus Paceibacterota bacterium]